MKNIFVTILITLIGFSVGASVGIARPHLYKDSDYRKGNFTISKVGTSKLNNPCAKSALAALEGTIVEQAMSMGVDLPDTIRVDKVNYLENLGIFVIQSNSDVFSILTEKKNGNCQARLFGIDHH